MRTVFSIACSLALLVLASCSHESVIEHVREVPLKTPDVPAIQTGLHRAQVTYLLRGALTAKERQDRLGQYYFVTWVDAHPEQSAELIMNYQQAGTGSAVKQKAITLAPDRSGGTRKDIFQFTGEEHVQLGEVLTWRVDLKVGGKLVSSKHSFLWRDDFTTRPKPFDGKSFELFELLEQN